MFQVLSLEMALVGAGEGRGERSIRIPSITVLGRSLCAHRGKLELYLWTALGNVLEHPDTQGKSEILGIEANPSTKEFHVLVCPVKGISYQ